MNLDKDTVKKVAEPFLVKHLGDVHFIPARDIPTFATALLKEAQAGNEAVAEVKEDAWDVHGKRVRYLKPIKDIPIGAKFYTSPPTQEACGPAVTAEYDLSPSLVEGKIKNKLIELGWSPPQEVEALKAKLEAVIPVLHEMKMIAPRAIKGGHVFASEFTCVDNALATIANTNELQEPNTESE